MTRVGDLEREAARARLVEAYAAGRIDPAELEARAERVWAASHTADLAVVVGDLGEDRGVAGEASRPRGAWAGGVRDLLVFLICSSIAVIIWHVTGRGFFWPLWVLVYTGLPIVRVMTAWLRLG